MSKQMGAKRAKVNAMCIHSNWASILHTTVGGWVLVLYRASLALFPAGKSRWVEFSLATFFYLFFCGEESKYTTVDGDYLEALSLCVDVGLGERERERGGHFNKRALERGERERKRERKREREGERENPLFHTPQNTHQRKSLPPNRLPFSFPPLTKEKKAEYRLTPFSQMGFGGMEKKREKKAFFVAWKEQKKKRSWTFISVERERERERKRILFLLLFPICPKSPFLLHFFLLLLFLFLLLFLLFFLLPFEVSLMCFDRREKKKVFFCLQRKVFDSHTQCFPSCPERKKNLLCGTFNKVWSFFLSL